MKESQYQKKVLRKLRARGGFWINVHGGPYQMAGLPDIIGCRDGQFYGIELKVGDNKPSDRQLWILAQMYLCGAIVDVVWDSVEDALAVLEDNHKPHKAIRRWVKKVEKLMEEENADD